MYRVALNSASLTTANGALVGTLSNAVYSVQWTSPNTCLQLTQLELRYALNTTFTASQDVAFGFYLVHNYTTAPSGGLQATFGNVGTVYTTNSFDQKGAVASYFQTGGDMRICTTGSLTAGVGTIDRYPMFIWSSFEAANGVGVANATQYPWEIGSDPNTHTITLQQYDGFVIAPIATMGAGGVLNFYVATEWIETPNAYAHG